jgi:hypothetical protein
VSVLKPAATAARGGMGPEEDAPPEELLEPLLLELPAPPLEEVLLEELWEPPLELVLLVLPELTPEELVLDELCGPPLELLLLELPELLVEELVLEVLEPLELVGPERSAGLELASVEPPLLVLLVLELPLDATAGLTESAASVAPVASVALMSPHAASPNAMDESTAA